MNLIQLFDLSFQGRANEPALEWQGRTYNFADIDMRSSRMAQLLHSRGLAPGDRLGIYLSNRIEFIDLYLACLKLGVIAVPINILYRERELSHILNDAQPKLLVTAAEIDELSAAAQSMPATRPELYIDGDCPAAIIYTSGTTGASKGAVLTHNNLAVNATNVLAAWQIAAADRLLLALPLFHVHGLANGLHCWLISGLRLRLLERFEAAKAEQEFLDFQPTVFFGVPAMYVRLMDLPESSARRIGAAARLFVCGSAPLPAQLMMSFRELYGSTILERYGMTETLMIASNLYTGERRPGSVGFALPGVSVKIVAGEVLVKGPNVFSGYWGRPEATAAAFIDGWFQTGDIATQSPDGFITLEGRRSDLIISGGFNIYPREIEEFLLEQPEVLEAAVAAQSDRVRGEVPVAYLVLCAACDLDDLDRRCRAALASFKIPREFLIVQSLPRNALGKVQKHLLASMR